MNATVNINMPLDKFIALEHLLTRVSNLLPLNNRHKLPKKYLAQYMSYIVPHPNSNDFSVT